jgi:selenocysteine lyase/cysteine desulfurase
MRAQERALTQPLLDYLAARNDLRLIGPRSAEGRAPTVAVALDRDAEPVAAALAAHGIMAGAATFMLCARCPRWGWMPRAGCCGCHSCIIPPGTRLTA